MENINQPYDLQIMPNHLLICIKMLYPIKCLFAFLYYILSMSIF